MHHASDHVVPDVGFAHSTPVKSLFSQVRSPEVSPIHSVVGGYCVELEVLNSLLVSSELHDLEVAQIGSLLEDFHSLFISNGSTFSGFFTTCGFCL